MGCVPIASVFLKQIHTALKISQADDWAREIWWDWWASWVIFGGPLGRWVIGTGLGYVILKDLRSADPSLPGQIIEQPHLRVAVIVVLSVLFSLFTLVSRSIFCTRRK